MKAKWFYRYTFLEQLGNKICRAEVTVFIVAAFHDHRIFQRVTVRQSGYFAGYLSCIFRVVAPYPLTNS
jgi:hypothetical protein